MERRAGRKSGRTKNCGPAERATALNTVMVAESAINYSARVELVDAAVNAIVDEARIGQPPSSLVVDEKR